MSFDFSTLVTDRTQADVFRVREIASKIIAGTASDEELAEFHSATMKGAYNYTDLNRVTAAMDSLVDTLNERGYAVDYKKIKLPREGHWIPGTSKLPEGYTEVAWIQSTGAQYVDAALYLNSNSKVVLDCNVAYGSGWTMVMGSYGNSADFSWWTNANKLHAYYGQSNHEVSPTSGRSTLIADKNVWTGGDTQTFATQTFTASSPMYLFSISNGGNYANANIKLYSCQVYDNDNLVRDFIPCINPNGEAGLFDLVTNAFFGNAGTGKFVAAPIPVELPDGYTQLDKIIANGSQAISVPNFEAATDLNFYVRGSSLTSRAFGNFFEIPHTDGKGNIRTYYHKEYNGWFVELLAEYYTSYSSGTHEFEVKGTGTNREVYIDGVSHGNFTNNLNRLSGLPFTSTLYIGAFDASARDGLDGEIEELIFYHGANEYMHFVPAKRNSDGVVGVYETVSGVFYLPAASSSFKAGNEIIKPGTPPVFVPDERDPYVWFEEDIPTTSLMLQYVSNVAKLKAVVSDGVSIAVPADMVGLTIAEANAIEQILVTVNDLLMRMLLTLVPAGTATSGGDYL